MKLPISREVVQNKIVTTISVAELLRLMGRSGVWVFIPIYLLEVRGIQYVEIGILFVLSGIASIPFSIFGGNLVDKIGRRKIALLMPPTLAVLFFVMFLGINYHLSDIYIYATFILFAAVASLQSVIDMVIVTDSTNDIDRIDAFSLTRIGANVGFSLGPAISGFVVSYNYAILPLIPMISESIGFYLFYRYINYNEAPPQAEKSLISFPRGDNRFLMISILLSLAFFATGPWAYILNQFLSKIDLIPNFVIGLLFATNGAVVVGLQLPVNRLFYRTDDMKRVAIGLLIYAATFAVFGITRNIPLLFLDVVFLTIGENVISPPMNSVIGRIAPEGRRGEYYGGFSLLSNFVSPFSPIVYASMLAFFYHSPLLLWGLIGMICVALAAAIPLTRRRWDYQETTLSRTEQVPGGKTG
ncbi:MAG: MFS transporter [Candidatus Thermoplasmatota archaeon]|jgi:MFS family permease|nr:MFS transporter [Candidatus Thermoplasmatota archaeon]MCL5789749.1 MFS transporter [Candidatus Thermoplasmatota archaeon]